MTITTQNIVLLFTILAVALMAGLFYNWTTAITDGLGKLADKEYLSAFQSINKEIQNPLFFIAFMGAALLLPICSFMHFEKHLTYKFYFIFAATLVYLIGVLGVTILGNVPLNDALDKLNLAEATPSVISQQRLDFEAKWNNFNAIRTISSFISLVLILMRCIFNENE